MSPIRSDLKRSSRNDCLWVNMAPFEEKMTDNEYIVLARKYRPKKFSDIIGQDEVCSVIEGAIKLNRVAHAFLFSGTRGIGKTTIARILANTIVKI